MEVDQINAAQLKKLQKQLEEIIGKDLDLSVDKLVNFIFPVASYDFEDGQVTFQHIFLPRKSCSDRPLLDVAGNSSTAADGKRVFLLSDFICSTHNSFGAPVNLVATPRSEKPFYTTTALKLVPNPAAPGSFNDLEITVFTWTPNGSPAPDVSVDWRCRLVSFPVIL
jgi:hypothetical protein